MSLINVFGFITDWSYSPKKSNNTAINIFVNQVVRSRAIPFIITSKDDEKEEIRKNGLEAFYQIRKEMEESNDEEISLSEINKEIKLSRQERK